MPKRVPKNTEPFRPVETKLVSRVMQIGSDAGRGEAPPERPAENEPIREQEPQREDPKRTVVEMPAREPARATEAKPAVKPRRGKIERFALSSGEKGELTVLVNELSLKLDTSIKPSNLHRALHVLLRHSKAEILRRATQRQGHLNRPGNDNHVGMAEFEHELARIIALGLKDAPPLREV